MKRTCFDLGRIFVLAITVLWPAKTALFQYEVLAEGDSHTGETDRVKVKRFPIGFWSTGLDIEHVTEKDVDTWSEAGITLTHGPTYEYTPENAARMKKVLDWAHKKDIQIIVHDSRCRVGLACDSTPLIEPTDFGHRYRSVLDDYSSHPAMFGVHISDEPVPGSLKASIQCARIAAEMSPHLHPFINHLPYNPEFGKGHGYSTTGQYLEDFLRQSKVDILSYDCYVQMKPGEPGSGWDLFFGSLYKYGRIARRHNIDFWSIILSSPHLTYDVPNEESLRWQFNCAVAFGCRGVFYYTFYTPQDYNFRSGPIDMFGNRTEKFDWIRRINNGFLQTYGNLFLELELEKVSLVARPFGPVPLFSPDELIAAVEPPDHPFVVSRFRDLKSREYIMVVNNAVERSVRSKVLLQGPNIKIYRYDLPRAKDQPEIVRLDDKWQVCTWLAPGQEVLYRIDKTK